MLKKLQMRQKNRHEALKIDVGENYWGYTAELYLSASIWIKGTDKTYGSGASKFIGEALKFYSENSNSLIKNYERFGIQNQSYKY